MRLFTSARTTSIHRSSHGGQGKVRSRELPDSLRRVLPARFEALGEALAADRDVEAACSVTGRELARDGIDLAGALEMLHRTYAEVVGREPAFAATHALCLAWSEETLGYLHQLSCEDPLTGLATMAHLRARLSEIYRGEELAGLAPGSTHALVVVDVPGPSRDHFGHALRQVQTVETVRLVFPGSESIGVLSRARIAVVTRRDEVLGRKVKALRTLLEENETGWGPVRVWIEGLPSRDSAAGAVLDELARS